MDEEISIIYDKVRFEEKELFEKAQKKGVSAKLVDAKNIVINTDNQKKDFQLGNIIFQRCLSHFRGTYLSSCLEFLGYNVINPSKVAEICGNKMETSLVLKKNSIPTPKSFFTFSAESFSDLINNIEFPMVLKPIFGSWGRGVFPLRNKEVANMILEMREENDNPMARIYYLQEMINRPERDLRCIVVNNNIVASVYRYSAKNEWRTNVARGGKTEIAPVTKELEDIVLKTANVIGGGILGVDLMEDKDRGLVVHEVNNNVEFRGATLASNKDIAGIIIDFLSSLLKK